MGFSGIPLDMITVTSMSMLLGLAVDDTIHFITRNMPLLEAMLKVTPRVFKTIGVALFLTSIVLVACIDLFCLSALTCQGIYQYWDTDICSYSGGSGSGLFYDTGAAESISPF